MPSYTSTTKISGRLKGRTFDATSKPTSTEVGQFITDVEAEIDERLRTFGFSTVPIEDSGQIAALSPIATSGAAYYTEVSCETPRYELADMLWKEYQQGLKDISDGKIITKDSGDKIVHPQAYHSSHVLDSNVESKIADDDDFEFTTDTEF